MGGLGGCLFPAVDRFGGIDATADSPTTAEAGEAAVEAGPDVEAGPCAPNSDPTLVAFYPFYEGSGAIAHDCSGHGYDALITSMDAGSVWTTGHVGGAIAFASNKRVCVIVGSGSANQSGGPLTVTAWINVATGASSSYVVGQRHTTGNGWRLDVETNDAGDRAGFAVGSSTEAGTDDNAATTIQPASWHAIAGVFDPSGPTLAVYVDGLQTLSSSPASVIVPDPIATTIRIGCRGDDAYYFDGVIDEVRIYSRALSSAEVLALAQ